MGQRQRRTRGNCIKQNKHLKNPLLKNHRPPTSIKLRTIEGIVTPSTNNIANTYENSHGKLGVREYCLLFDYNLTDKEIEYLYDFYWLRKPLKRIAKEYKLSCHQTVSRMLSRAKMRILLHFNINPDSTTLRQDFLSIRKQRK